MATYILDPTAAIKDDITDRGPDAGSLAGKTIGFRVDILWRSWDWVSDIWAEELRKEGATVKFWRPHGRSGAEGDQALAEMKEFWGSVDVAIVGLGNCGSCTGWTIHDALAAAATDIPTMAVVTQQFEQLGAALAKRGGRSGLRQIVLPYPLDVLPKEEVEAIARSHYPMARKVLGIADAAQRRAA